MITEQQILFLNEMIDIKTQLLILAEKFEKHKNERYSKILRDESYKIDNLLNYLKNNNKKVAVAYIDIITKTRTVLYRGRIDFGHYEMRLKMFSRRK